MNTLLIVVVLVVIAAEVLALLLARRPLLRQMRPAAFAGLFLALALLDLQQAWGLLPLWLAAAGAAHLLDWRSRFRQGT